MTFAIIQHQVLDAPNGGYRASRASPLVTVRDDIPVPRYVLQGIGVPGSAVPGSAWRVTLRARETNSARSNICRLAAARHAASAPAAAVQPWARAYGLLPAPGGPHTVSLIGPGPDFDPQYAMTTDLDEPLIIATIASPDGEPVGPLLIDGCHIAMTGGYQPRHPMVRVFTYQADPAGRAPETIAEEAFTICNGHPRDAGGEEVSRRYYARELRSLSVGDVVAVGEVPLAVAQAGWTLVRVGLNEVRADGHGTHPLPAPAAPSEPRPGYTSKEVPR